MLISDRGWGKLAGDKSLPEEVDDSIHHRMVRLESDDLSPFDSPFQVVI
ncbi:MAG: hypothetical protein QXH91_05000 [Candidatus Bathyarchaeia archaeon]